jgi:hypothetical protein
MGSLAPIIVLLLTFNLSFAYPYDPSHESVPSKISCRVDRQAICLGDPIVVFGKVHGLNHQSKVILVYSGPSGLSAEQVLKISSEGSFTGSYLPKAVGFWSIIAASSPDRAVRSQRLTVYVSDLPQGKSRLNIRTDHTVTFVGNRVRISGEVVPYASRPLGLVFKQDGTKQSVVPLISDRTGDFEYEWYPESAGKYDIFAELEVYGDTVKSSSVNVRIVSLDERGTEHECCQARGPTGMTKSLGTWTVMVYIAMDNNLGFWGADDRNIEELESVGSGSNVNIVVFRDDTALLSVPNTQILYINPGSHTVVNDYGSNIDSGSGDTLKSFIQWTKNTYPAENYILMIHGHGGGFTGVCSDDRSHSLIDMEELKDALVGGGVHFEIIMFDSCVMQMTSVITQMAYAHISEGPPTVYAADYIIASQELTYAGEWPYREYLTDLRANTGKSAKDQCHVVINAYANRVSVFGPRQLSAVNVNEWMHASPGGGVYSPVYHTMTLAEALEDLSGISGHSEVTTALSNTREFAESDVGGFRDLMHLATNLNTYVGGAAVKNEAQKLASSVSLSSTIEANWARDSANANGISIFSPTSGESYLYAYDYQAHFASATSWNGFVRQYKGMFDMEVSMIPPTGSCNRGSAISFTVTVTRYGSLTGNAELSIADFPSSLGSYWFAPSSTVSPTASCTLTISVSASAPTGYYILHLWAKGTTLDSLDLIRPYVFYVQVESSSPTVYSPYVQSAPRVTYDQFEGKKEDKWEALSGASTHSPTAAVFNNRLYVFVKGATSNALYYRYMDTGGVWTGWSALPGASVYSPFPVAFNNRLYVFVRGASNTALYYRYMDTADVWTGWSALSGGSTHGPAAMVFSDNLYLFVKGASSNAIYFNHMTYAEAWVGWKPLSGSTSTSLYGCVYQNSLNIFAKGATSTTLHTMSKIGVN